MNTDLNDPKVLAAAIKEMQKQGRLVFLTGTAPGGIQAIQLSRGYFCFVADLPKINPTRSTKCPVCGTEMARGCTATCHNCGFSPDCAGK